MPKAALHTLRWLPARGEYACLDGCEQVEVVTPPEHSQLLRWLCGMNSFAFHGCAGAYTVRRRAMLNVSQQEIDFLYERTEGWIAGLFQG